jgi:hypothetical protein
LGRVIAFGEPFDPRDRLRRRSELELKLIRKNFTEQSTIGELSVDGAFECFTLEDKVRPVKIKGETAIPAGTYEVAVTFSNKFQKFLPLLLDVPNFDGIRIHTGNTPKDTPDCILVGQGNGVDSISNRRRFRQIV